MTNDARPRVPALPFFAALLAALGPAAAQAPTIANSEPFKVKQAILYQPDPELRERLGGDGTIATFYLKQIETEAKKIFAAAPRGEGCSGALIATVKPGSRSKIWLAFPARKRLATPLRRELEAKLGAIPAPVATGTVALGLAFSAWGGDPEADELMRQRVPIPDEWRIAARRSGKQGLPFDEMLALAWP